MKGRQSAKGAKESVASLEGSKQRGGGLRGLLFSARSLGRRGGGGEGSRGKDDQVNLPIVPCQPYFPICTRCECGDVVNPEDLPAGFTSCGTLFMETTNDKNEVNFIVLDINETAVCIIDTTGCSIFNSPSPVHHLRAKRVMSAPCRFCPGDLSLSLRREPKP